MTNDARLFFKFPNCAVANVSVCTVPSETFILFVLFCFFPPKTSLGSDCKIRSKLSVSSWVFSVSWVELLSNRERCELFTDMPAAIWRSSSVSCRYRRGCFHRRRIGFGPHGVATKASRENVEPRREKRKNRKTNERLTDAACKRHSKQRNPAGPVPYTYLYT